MRNKWEKQYFRWGITLFIVIACSIIFYYMVFENHSMLNGLNRIVSIFMPIINGCIIAYILRPIVNFIEQKPTAAIAGRLHLKQSQKTAKLIRMLAIFITFVISFLALYTLLYLLIPQLFFSIENLISRLPSYFDNFQKWLLGMLKNNPDVEKTVGEVLNQYFSTFEDWITTKFLPQLNGMIGTLSSGILNAFVIIKNFFLGCFVAVYILNSKEVLAGQFKKLFYALLPGKHADGLIQVLYLVDETFSGFLSGKLLDSLIIGILCFVYTSVMDVPYYILISVVIGVTNIIPFFGPYIGAIPCIFLILIVDPLQSLYFLIFIILLQTFDGNYLGPKILGNKTGLSSFLVLCSILIFGGLFGVIGMIIGVPTTAVLYAGIRTFADRSLKAKNMPTKVCHYMNHMKCEKGRTSTEDKKDEAGNTESD